MMFDKVKFLLKWDKFGLGLRRMIMNLGDKESSKSMTAWGIAIVAIDGLLYLVSEHFGAFLPAPWGAFLGGVVGLTGFVMMTMGLRRAVGNSR